MAQRGPRRLAVAASPGSLDRVLDELRLPARTTTLVINGGTSAASDFPVQALCSALAAAVAVLERAPGPVIVSGGTDAGLFSLLGGVVAAADFAGPVIGVVPTGKVTNPDATPLEPHHTHVVTVMGDSWGDETATMLELCAELDRRGPVLVIIAGGGRVAQLEIDGHSGARRSVVVLTGTGRLADELAARTPPPSGLRFVPVDDEAALRSALTGPIGRA